MISHATSNASHFVFLALIVLALSVVMFLWYRLYRKIKQAFKDGLLVVAGDKEIPAQTFFEWLRTTAAWPMVLMICLQVIVLSVMSYNVASHYDLGHMFGF
jgi:membrane protease YdiL (CAAX protease family)